MSKTKLIHLADTNEELAIHQLRTEVFANPEKWKWILRLVVFLLKLGRKREYDAKTGTFQKVSFWRRLFDKEFWTDLAKAVRLADKIVG
jgi:hypothetical protein